MRRALVEIGGVLFAWLLVLSFEHLAVGIGFRDLIAGSWEMAMARTLVSPIVLALLLPCAVLARLLSPFVSRAADERAPRAWLTGLAAIAGGALGVGITKGRHFSSLAMRVPFVVVMAGVAILVVWQLLPPLVRLDRRAPEKLSALAVLSAGVLWIADQRVLPHLYPWFHVALLALLLAVTAPLGRRVTHGRIGRAAGMATLVLGVECAFFVPYAAARLGAADNLRRVLVEHAPLMGRAVLFAARISPPTIDDDAATAGPAPGEIPRALDWSGRDLVLVSVDALRADHVGAYGYPKATTPNLDALAGAGVVFRDAYCATPNTSYSIASMMTGKYMRPLVELGLGGDSDTWAQILRRYGYRTAAFYPPAVFFVDEQRFTAFEERGFDFEYRKTQFASPGERAREVADYFARTKNDARPVFLWVHLFEPHEPYEAHADHVIGDGTSDVSLYDGEIAVADDGIGAIVAEVRAARPHAVVIVTADHGEEFGEHGGRYHGTTVYEEQVRVPLVVSGEGLHPGEVKGPVQSIDLLPTVLSALGIPRPARVRGRDLGPLLAGSAASPSDPFRDGFAYAETDDVHMLARGDLRLLCDQRAGACTLHDLKSDPLEAHDVSRERPEEAKALRGLAAELAASHGRYEQGDAQKWPEALRRGMQGDVEAAPEVGALLDDARLDVRRKAAEVTYDLHARAAVPFATRALAHDNEEELRRYLALALVRMGEPAPKEADAALHDASSPTWRARAALAFAEQGDARGGAELAAAWSNSRPSFEDAKAMLAALAKIKEARAVPGLVRSLDDVRLRPFVADALGAIGDPSARPPLLAAFREERYVSTRPHEARALVALGARGELRAPLLRFAGTPEPLRESLALVRELGLSGADLWTSSAPAPEVDATLRPSFESLQDASDASPPAFRLLVLAEDTSPVVGTVGDAEVHAAPLGAPAAARENEPVLQVAELGAPARGGERVRLHGGGGLLAVWLVLRSAEIPPPPPVPWDGGHAGPDVDPQR